MYKRGSRVVAVLLGLLAFTGINGASAKGAEPLATSPALGVTVSHTGSFGGKSSSVLAAGDQVSIVWTTPEPTDLVCQVPTAPNGYGPYSLHYAVSGLQMSPAPTYTLQDNLYFIQGSRISMSFTVPANYVQESPSRQLQFSCSYTEGKISQSVTFQSGPTNTVSLPVIYK